MHRLVQAVTRTPDPADPHRDPQQIDAARDQATRQLAAAVPAGWQDPAGWPAWRILLPHIDALASHAPPDTDTDITAYLLNEAGAVPPQPAPGRPRGRVPPARPRRPAAAAGRKSPRHPDLPRQPRRHLPGGGGPEPRHPPGRAGPGRPAAGPRPGPPRQTLATSRWNRTLPTPTGLAGDLGRAISAVRAGPGRPAADPRRRPPRHPDLADNLAGAYQAAGDLGRAIPLFEQALADRQRILGDDHPQTLASREQPRRRLPGRGGPGPGHPAVRAGPRRPAAGPRRRPPRRPWPPASNLAGAYQAAGDLGRAIPLYRADPRRPRAGAGRRPPPYPDLAVTSPRTAQGTWAAIPLSSRPSPTASGAGQTFPPPAVRHLAAARTVSARRTRRAPACQPEPPGGAQACSQRSGLIPRACSACCKWNDSRHDQLLPAGRPDHGPEGVEKRVAKPACLTIPRASFLLQSPV